MKIETSRALDLKEEEEKGTQNGDSDEEEEDDDRMEVLGCFEASRGMACRK